MHGSMPAATFNLVVGLSASTAAIAVFLWRQSSKGPTPLSLKAECVCGEVQFSVDAPTPVHLVCYCDDCQHYSQYCLATAAGADKPTRVVTDIQGGTRTCQVYRRNVRVTSGKDLLQFTYYNPDKVPSRPQRMFRAYTTCCHTPMISAFWNELTVMGLYAGNLKIGNGPLAAVLQPNAVSKLWDDNADSLIVVPAPEYRINCEYALAVEAMPPPKGQRGFPLFFLLRFLWRNFIVGPKVRVPQDFHMPQGNEAIMIQ
ncbi:expressed unknown protein [Seminavis robusta]|uniref:Uncharacterized protein n=1 Tax=Seminavis robusta TaxID=568900 RepID=A0A9N8ENN1_9STRA|nr:expressed unknown protein [Seminavis robusta]|eukprot:Sro1294_g260180.1 n/a (257) ;mRNA; r:12432-13202